MTAGQITEAFRRCGVEPRAADLQVCVMLGSEPDDVAEYIWDHWLGEPDDPSLEMIQVVVHAVVEGKDT